MEFEGYPEFNFAYTLHCSSEETVKREKIILNFESKEQ